MVDARTFMRDMIARGPDRGRAPVHDIGGENFTFNGWQEYRLLLKLNPDLAQPGEAGRLAWQRWGRTSVGKAFRTR